MDLKLSLHYALKSSFFFHIGQQLISIFFLHCLATFCRINNFSILYICMTFHDHPIAPRIADRNTTTQYYATISLLLFCNFLRLQCSFIGSLTCCLCSSVQTRLPSTSIYLFIFYLLINFNKFIYLFRSIYCLNFFLTTRETFNLYILHPSRTFPYHTSQCFNVYILYPFFITLVLLFGRFKFGVHVRSPSILDDHFQKFHFLFFHPVFTLSICSISQLVGLLPQSSRSPERQLRG